MEAGTSTDTLGGENEDHRSRREINLRALLSIDEIRVELISFIQSCAHSVVVQLRINDKEEKAVIT